VQEDKNARRPNAKAAGDEDVIPAPKVRVRPPVFRGGKHRDQRRRARSTERVSLQNERES